MTELSKILSKRTLAGLHVRLFSFPPSRHHQRRLIRYDVVMNNADHLDEHFELCKRIYLRLQAEGKLEETIENFVSEYGLNE